MPLLCWQPGKRIADASCFSALIAGDCSSHLTWTLASMRSYTSCIDEERGHKAESGRSGLSTVALSYLPYIACSAFSGPGLESLGPRDRIRSNWATCTTSDLLVGSMLGVVVHYCDSCGYSTPVEYSASVWIQEHTCNHVRPGLSKERPSTPFVLD